VCRECRCELQHAMLVTMLVTSKTASLSMRWAFAGSSCDACCGPVAGYSHFDMQALYVNTCTPL
jgi:hypothetical protein